MCLALVASSCLSVCFLFSLELTQQNKLSTLATCLCVERLTRRTKPFCASANNLNGSWPRPMASNCMPMIERLRLGFGCGFGFRLGRRCRCRCRCRRRDEDEDEEPLAFCSIEPNRANWLQFEMEMEEKVASDGSFEFQTSFVAQQEKQIERKKETTCW